jgi:hypothetical protein
LTSPIHQNQAPVRLLASPAYRKTTFAKHIPHPTTLFLMQHAPWKIPGHHFSTKFL